MSAVVAALSSTVSQTAPRYCRLMMPVKLATVSPPVCSDPGTNSSTLYRSSAESAAANTATTSRAGVRSSTASRAT